MSEAELDVAVIGGGAVGLAIAAALAPRVKALALFERHAAFGTETSSRNSEVIHAGIYYAEGSLKARLCVAGRRALYRLAAEHGIPHRKCGKIIVAVNAEQEAELAVLKRKGETNGVEGLRLLTAAEVRALEPRVAAMAGLLSPETGILSAHALMDFYAEQAEAADATLLRGADVRGLEAVAAGWEIRYEDSAGPGRVTARAIVNAAGLSAQSIMRLTGLDPEQMNLRLHPCKGEYFSVSGSKHAWISHLVYPTPLADLKSLGIHTVVSLQGGFKLGPSAFYVDRLDYAVDPANQRGFLDSVRPYLPFLEMEDLAPDMSGIRPKLSDEGESARDFHIAHEPAVPPGFFNLAGIDSPGLTASPAIGAHVADMVAAFLG